MRSIRGINAQDAKAGTYIDLADLTLPSPHGPQITPQRVHDPDVAFTIEYLHTIRIQQYLGKHNISLFLSRVRVCVLRVCFCVSVSVS